MPTVNGSIDLAWMLQAKPWQLRLAAAMMAPYNPMTAAVLYARAKNLDPDGRSWPVKPSPDGTIR